MQSPNVPTYLRPLIEPISQIIVIQTGFTVSDLPFSAGLLPLAALVLSGNPKQIRHAVIIGAALGLLTLTRGAAAGLIFVVALFWLGQRKTRFRGKTAGFLIHLEHQAQNDATLAGRMLEYCLLDREDSLRRELLAGVPQ